MSTEIQNIVAAARNRLPNLSSNYADRAIAQGRTANDVRAELLTMMTTDYRVLSKADMRKQVAQLGLSQDDPQARSSTASTGRANMEKLLRQQGMEPAR